MVVDVSKSGFEGGHGSDIELPGEPKAILGVWDEEKPGRFVEIIPHGAPRTSWIRGKCERPTGGVRSPLVRKATGIMTSAHDHIT